MIQRRREASRRVELAGTVDATGAGFQRFERRHGPRLEPIVELVEVQLGDGGVDRPFEVVLQQSTALVAQPVKATPLSIRPTSPMLSALSSSPAAICARPTALYCPEPRVPVQKLSAAASGATPTRF